MTRETDADILARRERSTSRAWERVSAVSSMVVPEYLFTHASSSAESLGASISRLISPRSVWGFRAETLTKRMTDTMTGINLSSFVDKRA